MRTSSLSLYFLLMFGAFAQCTMRNPASDQPQPTSGKPNVLILFADDQRADALGCSGNSYIRTPNIDSLADTGTRFANNYVMGGHHGAICAPSRAMLMSGKSLFHVYDVLDGVTTMPMYFAQHGYKTFGTGKWHNGASSFEATFQQGDNVFIGGMSDHYQVPCRTLVEGKLTDPVMKGFSTDLFADAAIGFLKQYADGDRENPFMCYVAFTAPHDPRSPRRDFVGMYPDGSIPLPGNFKKFHPFPFDDMQVRDENLAPWPRTPEIVQQSLSDYYALISHLDQRVGDIIATLKEKGLYENTIIVYAADNGLAIGSHGLLGKQDLYEHSMKVPLILAGPGIPRNKISDALVYLYDLFPTLTDLCNLPPPDEIDGTSISPVVRGRAKEVRSSLFTTYRNTVRAVRDKTWKLIRYPERDYTQLFNLERDPLELENLASQEGYGEKVEEMLQLMKEWQTTTDDTAQLTAKRILPLEYDPTTFRQVPDGWQPPYTLERYFKDVGGKATLHE